MGNPLPHAFRAWSVLLAVDVILCPCVLECVSRKSDFRLSVAMTLLKTALNSVLCSNCLVNRQ